MDSWLIAVVVTASALGVVLILGLSYYLWTKRSKKTGEEQVKKEDTLLGSPLSFDPDAEWERYLSTSTEKYTKK